MRYVDEDGHIATWRENIPQLLSVVSDARRSKKKVAFFLTAAPTTDR